MSSLILGLIGIYALFFYLINRIVTGGDQP